MAKFLIVPIGGQTGLTSITLGLVRALQQSGLRPAFFKPISQSVFDFEGVDSASHFAKELFHIDPPTPLTMAEVVNMISLGKDDDVMEAIVGRYNQAKAAGYDALIIEGMASDNEQSYLANKNLQIAASLHADIILVLSVADATAEQAAEHINLALHEYEDVADQVIGFILNKFNPELNKEQYIQTMIQNIHSTGQPLVCLGVVPFAPEKSARRMYDIARYLKAEVLRGNDFLMSSRVQDIVIAGRSATHMVDRFKAGALIIAPGDREDIMMAAALRTLSGVPLAGLILTCHSMPSESVQELVAPALKNRIPVLLTEYDTYQTANLLWRQPPQVPYDDLERMENMVDYVAEHIHSDTLRAQIDSPVDTRLSPPAFRYRLMEQARLANKRIVLPEGSEPRTVQAAVICHEKGIARCVLLAKPKEVAEVAKTQGLTLPEGLEVIDPDSIRGQYIEPMVALRRSKGLTPELAERQLEDTVVLGTMMLAQGEVDGLVSGAIHTTANTIRPALQLIKTAPNARLVSSIFFMLMPEQVLVYGDCAVNPEPTAEQLADIAIQSADSAKAFGIEPKVAMISYSTGVSGSGAEVEKVKQATDLAKERRPDLLIDGPLQYDAASVPSVGLQKAPNSPVAGQATVFVFPDLNTGNTTYKAVQRSAKVLSVGPMLQGLNKPVNDLSRGALVDDIVYTIAITAIQSTQMAAE